MDWWAIGVGSIIGIGSALAGTWASRWGRSKAGT